MKKVIPISRDSDAKFAEKNRSGRLGPGDRDREIGTGRSSPGVRVQEIGTERSSPGDRVQEILQTLSQHIR